MQAPILPQVPVDTARPSTLHRGDPAVAAEPFVSDDGGAGADGPSGDEPRLTGEAFARVLRDNGLSEAGTHLHQHSQACTVRNRLWVSVPHVITTHLKSHSTLTCTVAIAILTRYPHVWYLINSCGGDPGSPRAPSVGLHAFAERYCMSTDAPAHWPTVNLAPLLLASQRR